MTSTTLKKVDFEEVIDRLKKKLVIKSNRGLSELLGMSTSGISSGRRINTLQYAPIVETCLNRGIDLQYIFTGQYSESATSQSPTQAKVALTQEDLIRASEIVDRVLDKVLIEKSLPLERQFAVYKTLRPVLLKSVFEHDFNEKFVEIMAKGALTMA